MAHMGKLVLCNSVPTICRNCKERFSAINSKLDLCPKCKKARRNKKNKEKNK